MRTSTRSAQLPRVIGTFLRAAAFAVRYRQRRAPSQRDTHRQGTAAHVVNCPGGAASRRQGYAKTSLPPGTAGVRRLPLAATAAREAQLHVVPTAQPRASRQYTLQTAVSLKESTTQTLEPSSYTRWNLGEHSTTHSGTRLPITLENLCTSQRRNHLQKIQELIRR